MPYIEVSNRQAQSICRAFLLSERGGLFDCYDAKFELKDKWGLDFDHHELAYALDALEAAGAAKRENVGGRYLYRILGV